MCCCMPWKLTLLICIILGIGVWAYVNDRENEAIVGTSACLGTLLFIKCICLLLRNKKQHTNGI